MYKFITIICCFITITASAGIGDGSYAIFNISDSLLKNANVIKRMESSRFEITEKNKARIYYKVAYTILNEQGEKWSYFSEGYDKLRSIESFEGSLYDAMGKKIKSLKKADIKDVSGSDESLADDNRIKWHSFFYKVYPYTVEYEVEVRYKGTMFLPLWMPQERSVMSVQSSDLTVVMPGDNPLRYKMFNYQGQPEITEQKSEKVYSWKLKNKKATISEYSAPAWHEITTCVFLATEKFMLEEYEGSNASWKDFGKFVYDLKKDRDQLPDNTKQKVHELTDGLKDVKEKIAVLYKFMQDNTRFISIQLGIGGWQPFDAKFVATKRYGDCKALSNFMYSLLKEAGIRSVYTVTNRGDDTDYLLADFPSSQFNHVVLFVPLQKDTLWLECTSQTYLPGYVGGDNCNRLAVAVDENGGQLVRMPTYRMAENEQFRKVKAVLESDATLKINSETRYGGAQQDNLHMLINSLSKEKVKELLHDELDFATYDINQFAYKETHTSKLPTIDESLTITVSNYASITGRRLFITPNVMTRSYRKLTTDTARKYDILFDFEYRDIDSVEIELPKGYATEAMPQPVTINSPFGKYTSSVKLNGNKLFYYRSIEQYSGRFPAKEYASLVKYYEDVYKADRSRVVLVKNETEEKKAF